MARSRFHTFGSKRWTTIPFERNRKTLFDLLIDILFSVSKCLTIARKVIKSTSEETDLWTAKLHSLLQDSVSQIQLWSQCASRIPPADHSIRTVSGFANIQSDGSSSCPVSFQNMAYHDLPTAALSAFHSTAIVIILSLLSFVSAPNGAYEISIRHHAQSIISANDFIYGCHETDLLRGPLMMVFPLRTVHLWSPSPSHRTQAAERIWALDCTEQFNDVIPDFFFEDVAAHICHHRRAEEPWTETTLPTSHTSD